MKNITTVLEEAGIVIPDDKKDAFNKAFNENYKTIAEYEKIKTALSEEQKKNQVAQETLSKFEGLNPDEVHKEIAEWKQKAIDAEKEYNARVQQQEYDTALEKALDEYKFSSKSARSAILAELLKAKLPMHEGKILGLGDRMEQLKESDAQAFAPDKGNAPKFTAPKSSTQPIKSKAEIAAIEDDDERMKAWKEYVIAEEG